jgi:hypothetical protein
MNNQEGEPMELFVVLQCLIRLKYRFSMGVLILILIVWGLLQSWPPTYAKEDDISPCKDPFAGAGRLAFNPKSWKTNFCKHSVPYKEILGGGPPRDGIPPLDKPTFISVKEAKTWLKDREPVIAFESGGDTRAYPLQILIWHEIVNDVVNNQPVVVTF